MLQKSPVFTSVVILAIFVELFLKESYLTDITYSQVTGTPLRSGDYCYGSRRRN